MVRSVPPLPSRTEVFRTDRLTCLAAAALTLLAPPTGAAPANSVAQSERLTGMLESYCLDCHDDATSKGEFNLVPLLSAPVPDHAQSWEKVIRRLESREMPPPKKDRPDEQTYREALAQLTAWLDQSARDNPKPGRTDTIRRLTRTEYRNAIRDLLALEIDVTELLPKDESAQGFDNITVGTLSPTLLDRYVTAARKISSLAVGRDPGSPQMRVVRIPGDRTQEEHVKGLPLGTRGGILLDHYFPVPGEYEFRIRLTRDRNEHVEGLREPHQLEVLIDRAPVAEFTVKPPRDRDHAQIDAHLTTRLSVAAGPRKVGITFRTKNASLLETKRQPYEAAFNMHRHPRRTPAIFQVTISGPHNSKPPGNTPSRERIFTAWPDHKHSEDDAAREILTKLLRRAYRRPLTDDDLARPTEFFRTANEKDGFEAGIEMALSSILVSPRFLLRVENDPPDLAPGTPYPLDDLTLASRLSFFLWSSLPDDALLEAATLGQLSDPAALERHARRMLADPRATALATNFAGQWLHLRNLDSVTRNLRLFPDFDDNLRQAFRRETELLFEDLVRRDSSILKLLVPDWTYLNERLAKHYRIPHVHGSRFRRVPLTDDSHCGGLLRQGSILTVTSYANRTSPVIRGNWILENILGTPTPPPPPDIPVLDETVVAAGLPFRERLALHSSDRSCAVCHDRIDPLGFPLENFDAVGRWRDTDNGRPIDASGGFSDGRKFNGVAALEDALLRHPELFTRTLTEKLMTYALGRGLDYHDAPAVRRIVSEAAKSDYRFSAIITGIVKSTPFTMKESQ